MTQEYLQQFFDSQLAEWPDCKKRYDDLSSAKRKVLDIDGREYTLTFNPARMRSATAKVDNGKVERPCFLCRNNRPDVQKDIALEAPESGNRYLLSVNPFPILTNHFTVINDGHCRQEMNIARLKDMAYLAKEMQGYLVFFNGACSGASAPDHFHFQAVPQNLVPLVGWNKSVKACIGVQRCEAENVKIDFDKSDFSNILCWNTQEGLHWWVVNRRQHRPRQYFAEGDDKVLISPASLEFAGMIPLAREEDFDKMDSALLSDIYDQCWNREPLVDVGIGPVDGTSCQQSEDGTFMLKNVRIGIGFHWDQKRDFTYEGKLVNKINDETGEQWNVNRLPVENYLKSVISSEMSATSSLALLKAHAVISRSWLMRQIMAKELEAVADEATGNHAAHNESADAGTKVEESHIKWYDSHSHVSFDVCADDHCQRYQGIAANMNPLVVQAIEETRGEVLMYDGEICDARFSKCCGGITEEYKYCWENLEVPYLQAVPDSRADGSVFCNTSDKTVLQQVLKDYDQATTDFYEWMVEYTTEELSELIERKLHLGFGRILDLQPLERGKSGRISRLKVVGEKRTLVIGKELEIRKALSETHLYSSAFDIVRTDKGFVLKGRGWGHGVGLCQIGAAVMGAEGYDYKEILMHYYKNAEIKKIW